MKNWLIMPLLAVALLFAACGKSEEEKRIEELTSEIAQIDSARDVVEAKLDSATKERERILSEADSSKRSAADLTEKLRSANEAAVSAQRRSNELLAQLNKWKNRAEQLAKENTQLRAQLAEYARRVEAAEERVAAAEARAAAAEARVSSYQASLQKSYYVRTIDVRGYNNGNEFSRERIKSNADEIKITVDIVRPEGSNLGDLPMILTVSDAKGGTFTTENFTIPAAAAQATVTIDIKGRKLDLDKGRHTVRIFEVANGAQGEKKFETSFIVQSSLF